MLFFIQVGGHFGADKARGNSVHGDLFASHLFGKGLGGADHTGFCRTVISLPGHAVFSGEGYYVDDATEPALAMKAELAELQMTAREVGDVRLAPIVGEIAVLHEQVAALGAKQLELWQARRKARMEIELRLNQFWRTVEAAESEGDIEGEE